MRRESGQPQSTLHAQRRAVRARHRLANNGQPAPRKPRVSEIRERRWRILVLLTLAFGFEMAAAALTSPLLGINHIQVRNMERLLPAEAATTTRATAVPAGTNLLRAPLEQIERQMRALPWVQSVKVSRQFPHGLRVQFTQRNPAVIAQIGARRYEVSSNCIPIRPARAGQAGSLPLIVMKRAFEPRFGIAIPDEALQAAINIYYDANHQQIVHIAKIEVDQNGNICLNMKDGIQIQIGQTDDLATKLKYVQRIYEQDPEVSQRMVAINLSYPNLPACTPRNPAPTASGAQPNSSGAMQSEPVKPSNNSAL
jgi:cell division protein FtsQ